MGGAQPLRLRPLTPIPRPLGLFPATSEPGCIILTPVTPSRSEP